MAYASENRHLPASLRWPLVFPAHVPVSNPPESPRNRGHQRPDLTCACLSRQGGRRVAGAVPSPAGGRDPREPLAAAAPRGSGGAACRHRSPAGPPPVSEPSRAPTRTRTRGILDTSTVILLQRLPDAAALPDEPLITAVTLAELSVGPLVATEESERAARRGPPPAGRERLRPTPVRRRRRSCVWACRSLAAALRPRDGRSCLRRDDRGERGRPRPARIYLQPGGLQRHRRARGPCRAHPSRDGSARQWRLKHLCRLRADFSGTDGLARRRVLKRHHRRRGGPNLHRERPRPPRHRR